MNLSPHGGRGECRVPAAPAASCAKCSVAHEVVATVAPDHPAFPHAMVLTAYFVLSPVTGLFCHRRQRICGWSAPGRADTPSANLTPASGRQDHTTSPFAATSLVSVLLIAHGFKEPALRSHRAQNAAASTASRPASVTIAIRPSVGWDAKSSRCDLGGAKTEIFLQSGLDRWNQKTDRSTSLPCARTMRRECAPSPCGIST